MGSYFFHRRRNPLGRRRTLISRRCALAGVLLFFFVDLSFAQVRLPRLVSDGMVIQRGTKVRIWGWAAPGEKVTVRFAGETLRATTDDSRHWEVLLPAHGSGGPYNLDVDGINHIALHNVYVGEVWVCGGQSNMDITMERVKRNIPR